MNTHSHKHIGGVMRMCTLRLWWSKQFKRHFFPDPHFTLRAFSVGLSWFYCQIFYLHKYTYYYIIQFSKGQTGLGVTWLCCDYRCKWSPHSKRVLGSFDLARVSRVYPAFDPWPAGMGTWMNKQTKQNHMTHKSIGMKPKGCIIYVYIYISTWCDNTITRQWTFLRICSSFSLLYIWIFLFWNRSKIVPLVVCM